MEKSVHLLNSFSLMHPLIGGLLNQFLCFFSYFMLGLLQSSQVSNVRFEFDSIGFI